MISESDSGSEKDDDAIDDRDYAIYVCCSKHIHHGRDRLESWLIICESKGEGCGD